MFSLVIYLGFTVHIFEFLFRFLTVKNMCMAFKIDFTWQIKVIFTWRCILFRSRIFIPFYLNYFLLRVCILFCISFIAPYVIFCSFFFFALASVARFTMLLFISCIHFSAFLVNSSIPPPPYLSARVILLPSIWWCLETFLFITLKGMLLAPLYRRKILLKQNTMDWINRPTKVQIVNSAEVGNTFSN